MGLSAVPGAEAQRTMPTSSGMTFLKEYMVVWRAFGEFEKGFL